MMAHLAELRTSNIFAQFDYGDAYLNIKHYGEKYSDYAPVIDLHEIAKSNVSIAMLVGLQDDFSTPVDARRTKEEIGDKNILLYKEINNMSH
jgi:hypothetical protein